MTKQNMLRRAIYRLLVCLSALTLLIGQGSVPGVDPTPTPPSTTPLEESWEDWSARRVAAGPGLSQAGEAPEQPRPALLDNCQYNEPTKFRFTSLVYSGMSPSNYDENIYLHTDMCSSSWGTALTQAVGADYEPQLSPDGQKVVFVSTRRTAATGEAPNVYTMMANGTKQKRLTTAGVNQMPSYSPDGKKIVFISTRDGNAEIYVMNSDGTGQKRLTVDAHVDVEPDWSPDGKQIVWVRRQSKGLAVLYTMRPDGTGQKALLPPLPYAGQPRWSHAGDRLIFRLEADGDGLYDLAVVNANGTNLTVLSISHNMYLPSDFELGAWLPYDDGFIFSEIGYVWDNGWYISGTRLRQYVFTDTLHEYRTPETPFIFTPYLQSLDDTPPVSKLQPLPEFTHYEYVPLEWTVTDNYSNPHHYDIEVSTTTRPDWESMQRWDLYTLLEPYAGSGTYLGIPGDTVAFRGQAVDNANNNEPLKAIPDAWTRLYRWMVKAAILDARERPVAGALVAASPDVMNEMITSPTGDATLYIANNGRYAIEASKPGYAPSSSARLQVTKDETLPVVLTGPDEQFANGHFEDLEPLTGWQRTGVIESAAAPGRAGGQAARLGSLCFTPFCFYSPTPLGAHDLATPGAAVAVDPQGAAHVRYEGTRYGVINADGAIQPWPDLPVQGAYGPVQFGPDGRPYIMAESQFIRWDGGAWVVEQAPFAQETAAYYDMDIQARLHVLYGDSACGGCLKYTRRDPNGSWLPAVLVSADTSTAASLTVEPGGTAHVVYGAANYSRILLSGTITPIEHLPTGGTIDTIHAKYVNGRGLFIVYNQENLQRFYLRTLSGQWVTIAEGVGNGLARGLQADAAGNVYLLHTIANIPAISRIAAGQQTLQRYVTLNGSGPIYSFAVNALGEPHIVYGERVNEQFRYFYRRGVQAALTGDGAIAQPVTVGADTFEPTLSFFYSIEGGEAGSTSYLDVTFAPEGGQPVSLFRAAAAPTAWQHIWVDLTPYQGKNGVITFMLVQNSGARASVFIDEASVSSNMIPTLTLVEPNPLGLPVPADAWIDLYGENLQQGAQVFLGEAQAVEVEYIDTTHIRFRAPGQPAPGMHAARVVNPGGAESQLTLYLGTPMFTPIISR